jgi:hypothetical protein
VRCAMGWLDLSNCRSSSASCDPAPCHKASIAAWKILACEPHAICTLQQTNVQACAATDPRHACEPTAGSSRQQTRTHASRQPTTCTRGSPAPTGVEGYCSYHESWSTHVDTMGTAGSLLTDGAVLWSLRRIFKAVAVLSVRCDLRRLCRSSLRPRR